MRALRTQRFIVGGFALIVLFGAGFFVYSRNYEVSFFNVSNARSGRSVFHGTPWKEDMARFSKESQKQGRAFSPDTLNAKNPQNLTEQLASVFSKKMVSDPQFDIGKFSGKEAFLSDDILKSINQEELSKNPQLRKLIPLLPSDREILIINNNSPAHIKIYLGNVGRILDKRYTVSHPELFSSKGIVDEFTIVEEAITQSDFREVEALSIFFNTKAENLQKISVPSSAKEAHKKIITFLRHSGQIYSTLAKSSEDPFLGMTALQQLQGLVRPMAEVIKAIQEVKMQARI